MSEDTSTESVLSFYLYMGPGTELRSSDVRHKHLLAILPACAFKGLFLFMPLSVLSLFVYLSVSLSFPVSAHVHLYLCVCAPMCRYVWRPEEGIRSPGAGVGAENLGPLEGHQGLLLTEPSLQPLITSLEDKMDSFPQSKNLIKCNECWFCLLPNLLLLFLTK